MYASPLIVRTEPAAHLLATLVAASGHVDEARLQAIEAAGGFRQLGVSRRHFSDLVHEALEDFVAGLCERSWLSEEDEAHLDALLDAVDDPGLRLSVCRLALVGAAPSSEGWLALNHVLARWHVGPEALGRAGSGRAPLAFSA